MHQNVDSTSPANEALVKSTIVRCVERGLSKLGDSGAFAVIYIMKTEFGLPLEEIPGSPDRFVSVLRNIFGLGAKLLEQNILEELYLVGHRSEDCGRQIEEFAEVLQDDLRIRGETEANLL